MSDRLPAGLPPGAILICAGTDAGAAANLAEAAAPLLADRPAVALAIWRPPPLGGMDAVMDALYDAHTELRAAARAAAEDAARATCAVLAAHSVSAVTRVVADDRPAWQVILDVADAMRAEAIVAGASERGAWLHGALGGQARALAHRVRCPLLIVPAGGGSPRDDAPVVFAYDASITADHALTTAAAVLRPRPAIVATVWQPASAIVGAALLAIPDEIARQGADRLDDAARQHADEQAGDAAALLAGCGWRSEPVAIESARSVPAAIVAAADERGAAVIVTGTRGRSRVTAALLGSSAEGVLRHADRPVLLVPPATAGG